MSTPQFTQTGYMSVPKRSQFDMSHQHLTTTNFGVMNVVFSEEIVPNDSWRLRQSILARFQPLIAPVMSRMDVKFFWFFTPNRLLYSDWEKFIAPNVDDTIDSSLDRYSQPVINVHSSYTPPLVGASTIIDYFDSISDPVVKKDTARFFQQIGIPIFHLEQQGGASEESTFISLLPFMSYQRIWYDYFRDENLDDATPIPTHGGIYSLDENAAELAILFKPRLKSWDKDYFTSALPFAQKGPVVKVPLGSSAPVSGSVAVPISGGDVITSQPADPMVLTSYLNSTDYDKLTDLAVSRKYYQYLSNNWIPVFPQYSSNNGLIVRFVDSDGNVVENTATIKFENQKTKNRIVEGEAYSLTADLTNASATTIDMFETLQQLQRFYRRAAAVGTRYVELLKGYFGVTPSDARLQRAEYLGGCKIPVISNEVFSNTETINSQDEIVNPVGSYAGKANAFGGDEPIDHFFEEHGYLTCIMVVQPKTGYYQGLRRHLTERNDYTKFYWPQFAHLGEQEVKNREIFFDGSNYDTETFGYQSRYVEYKFIPEMISGDFQVGSISDVTSENLAFWHLYRHFDNAPHLNSDFIHTDPSADDLKRIFAVTDAAEDSILCQIQFDCSALRPMPVFAEPLLA